MFGSFIGLILFSAWTGDDESMITALFMRQTCLYLSLTLSCADAAFTFIRVLLTFTNLGACLV